MVNCVNIKSHLVQMGSILAPAMATGSQLDLQRGSTTSSSSSSSSSSRSTGGIWS